MIVGCAGPFVFGVVTVVAGAFSVFFAEYSFDIFRIVAVTLYGGLFTELHVGMDKDIHDIVSFRKEIIGAAADNNAWFFLCKVFDHTALCDKELIL